MRWFIAAFAALFLLPIYVALDALLGARRTSLFRIRTVTISKVDNPVSYRIYYVLFLLMIPMFAALALCLTYVAFIDPWGN